MTACRRLGLAATLVSVVAAPPLAAAAPRDDDRPLRRPELVRVEEAPRAWLLTYDQPADWVAIVRVYGDGTGGRDLIRTARSDGPLVIVPAPDFHHVTIRWVDRDSGRRSILKRVDIDDLLGTLFDDEDDRDPDDLADADDD